jgi:hypothetical protein
MLVVEVTVMLLFDVTVKVPLDGMMMMLPDCTKMALPEGTVTIDDDGIRVSSVPGPLPPVRMRMPRRTLCVLRGGPEDDEDEDVVKEIEELAVTNVGDDAGVSSPAAAAAPRALQFFLPVLHLAVRLGVDAATAVGSAVASTKGVDASSAACAASDDSTLGCVSM